MQISFNGRPIDTAGKTARRLPRNRFPDFLIFCGGKVSTAGGRAKFVGEVYDGSNRMKRWSDTIEYTELDGESVGNMFGSEIISKDDLSEDGINLTYKIDGRDANIVDVIGIGDDGQPLAGLYIHVGDDEGNTGLIGLALMF